MYSYQEPTVLKIRLPFEIHIRNSKLRILLFHGETTYWIPNATKIYRIRKRWCRNWIIFAERSFLSIPRCKGGARKGIERVFCDTLICAFLGSAQTNLKSDSHIDFRKCGGDWALCSRIIGIFEKCVTQQISKNSRYKEVFSSFNA